MRASQPFYLPIGPESVPTVDNLWTVIAVHGWIPMVDRGSGMRRNSNYAGHDADTCKQR